MARSKVSMPKAICVDSAGARTIFPREAILLRDKGLLKDSVLYCENYIKCDCKSLVIPVNSGEGFFRLTQGSEGHSPNCGNISEIESISTRIRNLPEGKKPVLKINDEDLFEGYFNNSSGKKQPASNKNTVKVATNVITRTVPGTRNVYIRNVSELIDLLNSDEPTTIKEVLKELYSQKMYYKRNQYNELVEGYPVRTFMVEGYLDKRDLKRLENKGYVYAYSDPINKPNSVRLMLVHNGKGKERFKAVVKDLLSWIESRKKENRKLAIIKGGITVFYEETNILVIQVKDIDIKYKKKEFNK